MLIQYIEKQMSVTKTVIRFISRFMNLQKPGCNACFKQTLLHKEACGKTSPRRRRASVSYAEEIRIKRNGSQGERSKDQHMYTRYRNTVSVS